jgi:hypothetical protein
MRTAVPLMTLVIEMSCDMCCIVYSMLILLQSPIMKADSLGHFTVN